MCRAACNAAAEERKEFDPEADIATASAEKRSVEDHDLVARGVVSDTVYHGRYCAGREKY